MKIRITTTNQIDGKTVTLADLTMEVNLTQIEAIAFTTDAMDGLAQFMLKGEESETEEEEEAAPKPVAYTVTLVGGTFRQTLIQIIKELRGFVNIGLKDAKDIVDGLSAGRSYILAGGLTPDEAVALKNRFEAVGAVVEIS